MRQWLITLFPLLAAAVVPGFPVRYLVAGADTSRRLDIQMMVWLVRGEGRNVLVDAGFYRDRFLKSWKVEAYLKPSEAVARLGVAPEAVTDVVISHAHWDHLDGADLFPKARIWIQREEYEYYRDPAHQPNSGVFSEDIELLQRAEREGRLQLVEGDDQEIVPGIRAYLGGRHTRASQYLSVTTAAGTVVLASDNLYLYENLERRRPIAQTWDSVSNLAAQERMKRLASSERLIVPGHDPEVFHRFKGAGPGVAAIR